MLTLSGNSFARHTFRTGDLVYADNLGNYGVIQEITTQPISLQAYESRAEVDLICYKVADQWYSTFEPIFTPINLDVPIGQLYRVVFYDDDPADLYSDFHLGRVIGFEHCRCANKSERGVEWPWLKTLQMWDSNSQDWKEIITSQDPRIKQMVKVGAWFREAIPKSSSLTIRPHLSQARA